MDIAFMIGGLVPTFLVSRIILWLMRSWEGGVTRLAVANVFSWLIASFIGGLGLADGGAFAGVQAAVMYAAPQGFWFVIDVVRHRRKLSQAAQPADAAK